MHWAARYVGKKWTKEQDCLYWYRRIKKEQFGREVPLCEVNHNQLTLSAARLMAGNIREKFGYHKTDSPVEGDAAFLSQKTRPHHVGMVIFTDNQYCVLHAVEGIGVIVSDMASLALNGWKIEEYWTDES